MKFCPKCGSYLRLKELKKGGAVEYVYACSKCGYTEGYKAGKVTERVEEQQNAVKIVGPKEEKLKELPTMEITCPKCGNGTAFWWLLQTRSGDEPATQFYRCTNTECNHTWRSYD